VCLLSPVCRSSSALHRGCSIPLRVTASIAFISLLCYNLSEGAAMWLVADRRLGRKQHSNVCHRLFCFALFRAWLRERIGIFHRFSAHFSSRCSCSSRLPSRRISGKSARISSSCLLLLPVFFVFTGMRTQSASERTLLPVGCMVIILIASVGKFGGSFFAAHITLKSDNS